MRAGLVISLLVIFLMSSGLAALMMAQQKVDVDADLTVGPSAIEAEVEPEVEPEEEPEAETTSPTTENYTYIKM